MPRKGMFAVAAALLISFVSFTASANDIDNEAPAGKTERKFEFTYTATIKDAPEGANQVGLWIPIPQDTKHQSIANLKVDAKTAAGEVLKPEIGVDPVHGNKMAYWHVEAVQAKGLVATLTVECKRSEVSAGDLGKARELNEQEKTDLAEYLKPNRLVLVAGTFTETANAATKGATTPMEIAKAAYDYTVATMKYDKPADKPGWGKGSTQWACDAKFGNCTDFHAMIMSIDRTKGVPVKFEMGFPLPPRQRPEPDGKPGNPIGGYHCWAKFYLGGVGWVPLDASEAFKNPKLKEYYFGNLTADRIQFTTGRDVNLVPKQAADPLNFFVYPYAEADGKPVPVEKAFAYKDLQ